MLIIILGNKITTWDVEHHDLSTVNLFIDIKIDVKNLRDRQLCLILKMFAKDLAKAFLSINSKNITSYPEWGSQIFLIISVLVAYNKFMDVQPNPIQYTAPLMKATSCPSIKSCSSMQSIETLS